MASRVLTAQAEDFPRWYQDIVQKAELAENGPVRGTMVIRPYGYALWELIQRQVDDRIKAAGAQNVSFPLFIPQSYFEREAEHVEGFSPELAVVTHAGGKELEEPVVVRPTSETVFGEYMAKWMQSYRDLPMLLNQWANVVRWEMRPRVFLRSTEFLWQEGHTAHASEEDAREYAETILYNVYQDFMVKELAMPVIVGRKTRRERFAGATNTMTLEAMMRDGKALQMGTSHELGQNFAQAFNMMFLDQNGSQQMAWTTSWGVSTRMLGGLIMSHGDDNGLRMPPNVAPIQVVVVVVRDDEACQSVASQLVDELKVHGIRARLDDSVSVSFGRRVTEWELKGVPIRVEVGPRDLAANTVKVIRRDRDQGQDGRDAMVSPAQASGLVVEWLERIQDDLYAEAETRRNSAIEEVTTLAEAIEASRVGFAKVPWSVLGEDGEDTLAESGVTVRCLIRPDGQLPRSSEEADLVAVTARAY